MELRVPGLRMLIREWRGIRFSVSNGISRALKDTGHTLASSKQSWIPVINSPDPKILPVDFCSNDCSFRNSQGPEAP